MTDGELGGSHFVEAEFGDVSLGVENNLVNEPFLLLGGDCAGGAGGALLPSFAVSNRTTKLSVVLFTSCDAECPSAMTVRVSICGEY
eukprot:TRINITY_DN8178_c0_g1_i1.p2 TRINITY_DN8178_c0_g1~~TRINITY_DN8178_c0_g1_i1.p2  ORF type:complete len:87 (-),score=10.20 TRINITY_DN8178_c0_g1_i1:20-280(-)